VKRGVRAPDTRRRARSAALALVAAACSCAHGPHPGGGSSAGWAFAADSITTGLWRFDETGGTHVADAGPFQLEGRAGLDTHTDFGRIHGARVFTRALDSFVYVPYNPVLQSGGGLTVEAWIYLNSYPQFEDAPIAARWTPQANEQSWMFSVVGGSCIGPQRTTPPYTRLNSPCYHNDLIQQAPSSGATGSLMFAYQPDDASPRRAYFSTRILPLSKWVHVAATFDSRVVRLWVDGDLDAQFATRGGIRTSPTGLTIGNFLDPRWLSDFSGDLRVTNAPDTNPYYAFDGYIDELRVSSAAREGFPYAKTAKGIGR
jgi:hypothetical protein